MRDEGLWVEGWTSVDLRQEGTVGVETLSGEAASLRALISFLQSAPVVPVFKREKGEMRCLSI